MLLAGPILRRVEPRRVCIWIATSTSVRATAEVFGGGAGEGSDPTPLGWGGAASVQLGERLFVHLLEVTPGDEAFPTDELLAYDVALEEGGRRRRLADLGLLDGAGRIAYGSLSLPTFFIRGRLPTLHLLHGSCRMLHGKGEDALLAVDELIARHARELADRPSLLIFTGDQIYGDEVAGPLIGHLTRLGAALCGPADEVSVPGLPALSTIPVYGRQTLMTERAKFTSDKAANHLASFGEYAAMYVTAWNEASWPAAFPAAAEAVPGPWAVTAAARRRYARELEDLQRARQALPAVRRVLANTPTYMMFDDHDVTDDWNLTAAWQTSVWTSPTGRRIVTNALATFWAFQGWGNDPDLYGRAFKDTIANYLGGDEDGDTFDSTLWSFAQWSFHAPTKPPTVVLDTRMQRAFDSPEGAARLIGEPERRRVSRISRAAGHQPGQPLILVSAVPVFVLELQERREKFLVGKVGPYEIDFEGWHSNLAGLVDLMRLLIEDLEPSSCILLSGDVHYGLNLRAVFAIGPKTLRMVQLVSSPQKHSGVSSKVALHALGRLVGRVHRRVGWDRPPRVDARLKHRVLARAANTDEWDDDAPVFLAPSVARWLGITQEPDYREARSYVPPGKPSSSVLVGENNVGLLSLDGRHVEHRLLGRESGETRVYTTAITLPEP